VTVVVAAAIVRDHRLLVAQRSYPAALAGCWELPGGKAEPDEADVDALRRECREELGVDLRVGGRVGPELEISPGVIFRAYAARITAGEPVAHEHAELRWVGAADLADLAWLAADRPLLPDLVHLLAFDGQGSAGPNPP
jgi:8-oxo-dGTP diphosphatase